ncbi:MAG: hypothetical protein ABI639_04815 [Thermoanaerobaculia bacterium]
MLVLSFIWFISNGQGASSGDNLGTRALASTLSTSLSADLSEALAGSATNYSTMVRDGSLRIAFPPGTGFLAAPIYAVDRFATGKSARDLAQSAALEKISAALLSALSVTCFFLFARRRFSLHSALVATVVLAAGTPVLTTLSQGLWSQTGEALALALALFFAGRDPQKGGSGWLSGAASGLALFCRPTALLLLPVPLAVLKNKTSRWGCAAALTIGGVAIGLLNVGWYGSWIGAYGSLNAGRFELTASTFLTHLAGVTLSPSRGLVWFFPALLFLLAAAWSQQWKALPRRELAALTFAVVALFFLVCSYDKWWGGHSIGPRLLAELSLPFAFLLAAGLDELPRGPGRRLLLLLSVFQVLLFSLLHFAERADAWNIDVAIDVNERALWSVRDSQLIASLTPGWRYEESGPYWDTDALESARAGFVWTALDIAGVANARYDLEPSQDPPAEVGNQLFLSRLTAQGIPAESHLRILPVGGANVVRICRGENSGWIESGGDLAKKIDTLILWRGDVSESQMKSAAGVLVVDFSNDKRSVLPLQFGAQIFLRRQVDLAGERNRSRFFAGGISAPDALQRQRFTLPGKSRSVERIAIEIPPDGPVGCLFLLGISLGAPP